MMSPTLKRGLIYATTWRRTDCEILGETTSVGQLSDKHSLLVEPSLVVDHRQIVPAGTLELGDDHAECLVT